MKLLKEKQIEKGHKDNKTVFEFILTLMESSFKAQVGNF